MSGCHRVNGMQDGVRGVEYDAAASDGSAEAARDLETFGDGDDGCEPHPHPYLLTITLTLTLITLTLIPTSILTPPSTPPPPSPHPNPHLLPHPHPPLPNRRPSWLPSTDLVMAGGRVTAQEQC